MHYAEKLPSKSETDASELWNYLECFTNGGYVNNKKGIIKRVYHNMLLKTLCIVLTFPSTLFPKVLGL